MTTQASPAELKFRFAAIGAAAGAFIVTKYGKNAANKPWKLALWVLVSALVLGAIGAKVGERMAVAAAPSAPAAEPAA